MLQNAFQRILNNLENNIGNKFFSKIFLREYTLKENFVWNGDKTITSKKRYSKYWKTGDIFPAIKARAFRYASCRQLGGATSWGDFFSFKKLEKI